MILQFLGDSFCVSFGRDKTMGYFNSIFSLLQDGSTYLSKRHPLDMLAEGSHLQCLNHKPQKNWSPTGHPWLRPSLWSESPKNWHVWPDVGSRISSTQDLAFVSFSFLDLGTLFINIWHGRIAANQQKIHAANGCKSDVKFYKHVWFSNFQAFQIWKTKI